NDVPKTSTKNEPKNGAVARASKQPDKNDIVLAPPQSAFTFSCSRLASTTANVRGFAGSQRNTPVRVSAAGSPLPKPPTSSAGLLRNGNLQGEELLVRRQGTADKAPSRTETIRPGVQSHPHNGVPPTQTQPYITMVGRDLALAHTYAADEVPGGWPIVEPLIMAPATKDRKSRFLNALSRMVTSDSKSSTGENEAATGTNTPEIFTSPVCYTDALEHQNAGMDVASKHASSHGSTDSGYATKSGSPSIEVSPTWSHSPSSEHDWEGRDAGFWMKE
ncbi:hypothetical protein MMC27_000541, partial [Xylographa pallens]|nr:hypothetical protein [Xylographa pallens]